MDKLLSNHSKAKIHVENDNLIMYGTSNESNGCVLRGVLQLELQEPTKIKSITLDLVGKMTITLPEGLPNGHDRIIKNEKTIYQHQWTFMERSSKMKLFKEGNYTYEFELVLPGDLSESINIHNLYTVQYQLKATIERSTFLPNISCRKLIHLSRQISPLNEFLDPFAISNQWANKLNYEISLPTKLYTHGDQVPIQIRITPLSNLKVRYMTCAIKEYMVCKQSNRAKPHGKVLISVRDNKFGKSNASTHSSHFIEWKKTQIITLPRSLDDLQCDIQNDSIRIKHKIKFVLSLVNPDGHISELRAAVPIIIYPSNPTGLPSYEETWTSIPYDPLSMMSLLYNNGHHLPAYHSLNDNSLPPAYDELVY